MHRLNKMTHKFRRGHERLFPQPLCVVVCTTVQLDWPAAKSQLFNVSRTRTTNTFYCDDPRSTRVSCHRIHHLLSSQFAGFPLSWLQRFPGLFQDPRSILPWPCRTPVMLKYKDEQQLLWGPGQSPGRQRFFSHIQIKSELNLANFGICIGIIVSASHIIA